MCILRTLKSLELKVACGHLVCGVWIILAPLVFVMTDSEWVTFYTLL